MTSSQRPTGATPMDELKLSGDEIKGFEKAFKDPEFVKMFGEYAQEINDPANKAETEMYLRQLEQQGEIESVYGKGTQLIIPTPEFVFKTKDKGDGLKVFVNMCSSEKVGKPELRAAQGTTGAQGQHLDLPLTGSNARREAKDKNGNKSWVYDITMHPEAFQMLQKHPKMLHAMVESAIEHIEKANDVKLDHKFSRPKLNFKGTPGHENKPAVTAIRGDGAPSSASGHIKPRSSASSSTAKLLPELGSSGQQRPEDPPAPQQRSKRSPFAPRFSNGTAPKTSRDPGFQHANGEVTPQHTIVHQGNRDLTEAWNDPNGRPTKGVPRALVVRITLPGLISAASVELDVAATKVTAVVPGKYRLELPLPFCVTDDGSAQFNRDSGVLTLTLPVARLKAVSSAASAAVSKPEQYPQRLAANHQEALLVDSRHEECEVDQTVEGCAVGASQALVQEIKDLPENVGSSHVQSPVAQPSHSSGSSHCESEGQWALEHERDGKCPAVVDPSHVEERGLPCGKASDGRLAGIPGQDSAITDVDLLDTGVERSVEVDQADSGEDFRPVPVSQRAPEVCSWQPSAVAHDSGGSEVQGSGDVTAGDDHAAPVARSEGGRRDPGSTCGEQLTQGEAATAAMQAVQDARSGGVSSDEVDLKALAAAWSVANATLDSKLSEGAPAVGDEGASSGQGPAASPAAQDNSHQAPEPVGVSDSQGLEARPSSGPSLEALEQHGHTTSAQQPVCAVPEACVDTTGVCQEASPSLLSAQAGSLPKDTPIREVTMDEHMRGADSGVQASVGHDRDVQHTPAVKLDMALDLPMLDELD